MGRTKGSKNRPKIEPFNPSKLDQEVKEVFDAPKMDKAINDEPHRVSYDEFHQNITGQYSKSVIDASPTSEPLPSNWNEMGKIQKLEWLTANPRK